MKAKDQIKSKLTELYAEGTVNAGQIFKGYAADSGCNGWHFNKFGRSENIFLGNSVAEVEEKIEMMKDAQSVVPWAYGS